MVITQEEFFERFQPGEKFELMDEYQVRLNISEADLNWLKHGGHVDNLVSSRPERLTVTLV